jgi:hypothetical protein
MIWWDQCAMKQWNEAMRSTWWAYRFAAFHAWAEEQLVAKELHPQQTRNEVKQQQNDKEPSHRLEAGEDGVGEAGELGPGSGQANYSQYPEGSKD